MLFHKGKRLLIVFLIYNHCFRPSADEVLSDIVSIVQTNDIDVSNLSTPMDIEYVLIIYSY